VGCCQNSLIIHGASFALDFIDLARSNFNVFAPPVSAILPLIASVLDKGVHQNVGCLFVGVNLLMDCFEVIVPR
jgi:hypothetical protein